jgi:hypothetical protein
MKYISSLILFALWTAACTAPTRSSAAPGWVPTGTRFVPTLPAAWTREISTPTLTPTPPPAWVGDFVAPILTSLDGQPPSYQDDFDENLNFGWFYLVSGGRVGPFQAHIEHETLLIKLPQEQETRDSMVYNPALAREDFVLTFDFQFEETQPPDYARFQFEQSREHSVTFDLIKDKTWRLRWGIAPYTLNGSFDYFPPERLIVTIIMTGPACAVVLNDDPIAYVEHCRSGSMVRAVPWAVTFHTVSKPLHSAAVTIDNVKFWDLDEILTNP